MKFRNRFIPMMLAVTLLLGGCSLSGANRYYSKALDAYEDKDYQAAQEYFVKAINENKDKAEYHIDYGFTLICLNEFAKAREEFEYVILDKEIGMVRENNKKAYRGIGISYLLEYQYDLAVMNFDLALGIKELKELNTDLLFYKASALEQKGDLEAAAGIYTSLLEQKPKDATIYSARANIYRLIGNYELSIDDYDQAIELSPQDFNLYLGKFASYMELNKKEEAQAVLAQAVQLKINSDKDKFELAKVHFYQGDYEIALNEFTSLIEKGFTEGYYYIGEIYLQQLDYEGALAQFELYLNSGNKEFGLLYNQMLTSYLQTGKLPVAKECLDKAKKIADITIKDSLLKNEIIYYEKAGEYEIAYTLISQYLEKYPDDNLAKKDFYFIKTRVEGANQLASEEDITGEKEPIVEKP